jgi:hypothetical protein
MSGREATQWRHFLVYLVSLLPSKAEQTYDSLYFE